MYSHARRLRTKSSINWKGGTETPKAANSPNSAAVAREGGDSISSL